MDNNIVSMKDYYIEDTLGEIIDIFDTLKDSYGVYVSIYNSQLCTILNSFYEYYQEKNIVYSFRENMISHFNDMAIDAAALDCEVTFEFVLSELKLYELLNSNVEVDPIEVGKIVKKLERR